MSQLADYTPDEMDTIWVSYQTESDAACPYCGSAISVELTQDPAESGNGSADPIVTMTCTGCGRKGINNPTDRNDSEQNPPAE